MNRTTLKSLMAVALVLCSMALGTQASALSVGDSFYIGLINDGIPSNPAAEAGYINNLITLAPGAGNTPIGTETYNRLGSSFDCVTLPCPPASDTGAVKNETGATTGNFGVGYSYLLAKYDAASAGSLVWYVGGLTGDFTLPSTLNGLGLSHWALYNPVPEPATFVLLGSALVGLALWARRKR